jgi:ribose-phosphate pyrophosphokinase
MMSSHDGLMVFTGNANPALAQEVVKILGIPLGKAMVSRFSDGEIQVEIQENVRGKDVFVLQSTCAPANDNLMELMIMVDALKRASAGRITAAIPYFGYARQDRRPRSARVAISAKVVANMLEIAGVERIITMDLHADQIQGFSTSRSTTSTQHRCCSAICASRITRTCWSCRRTSVVWSVPVPWRSN